MLEEHDAAAYHACVLGLRDYVDKNGFPGVVLGLSGGIDSRAGRGHGRRRAGPGARALRDAALPLHLQRQPRDAADCAKALGVRYDIVPIAPAVEGFVAHAGASCSPARAPDVTEENMQSRVRGTP